MGMLLVIIPPNRRRCRSYILTLSIALILLIGATVPTIAEEGPNQTFTCTAKTFNECLMEAPCGAWKRSDPKEYKLDTKIIFRGNPVEGELFLAALLVMSSKEMRKKIDRVSV